MKISGRIKASWILFEFLITVTIVVILMRLFNSKQWQIRKAWAKMQAYLTGYDLEIVGSPDPDAGLLLLNHQSLLDIIILDASFPKDLSWVAKKEIADMPFFGQILTLPKMVIVDRESKKSLVKLVADAKQRLEEGRVIAMFPEGTRGDGKKLLPFKMGARLLASKLNLKVQPAVIINTRQILDSLNFTAKSGKVKIIYLDPIDPKEDKEWFTKLHEKMQEVIDRETKSS